MKKLFVIPMMVVVTLLSSFSYGEDTAVVPKTEESTGTASAVVEEASKVPQEETHLLQAIRDWYNHKMGNDVITSPEDSAAPVEAPVEAPAKEIVKTVK